VTAARRSSNSFRTTKGVRTLSNRRHARLSAGRSFLSHSSPWESERCDSVAEIVVEPIAEPTAQQASAVTHEPCCCPCADGHEPSANCADRRKSNPRRISSRSSEDDSRRASSAHEVASTRLSESAKNPQPPSLFWVLRRNGMQVCAIKAESPSVRFSGTDCIASYLTPFASSAERVPRPPPPPHLPARGFPAG